MLSLRLLAIAACAVGTYASDSSDEDGFAAALEHDSELCEAGSASEECSLELRQLRASMKLRTDASLAEDADEPAKGVNLADISLAEENANKANGGDQKRQEEGEVAADSEDDSEQNNEEERTEVGEEGEPAEGEGENEEARLIQQKGQASWGQKRDDASWGHRRNQEVCVRNTERQCGFKNDCPESLGNATCEWGSCKCAQDHCFKDGYCMAISPTLPLTRSCPADTSGTCAFFGCDSSRGPTECKSGRCLCKEGSCAVNGKCMPTADTGGTCGFFGCGSSRGHTVCMNHKCVCTGESVAVNGRCMTQQEAFHNPFSPTPSPSPSYSPTPSYSPSPAYSPTPAYR